MRSSFFIASGKHEVFDILHGLGLAFFVELIEGVQQLCLGGSKDAVAFFWFDNVVGESFYCDTGVLLCILAKE